MECLNLKELYGEVYRVKMDSTYKEERRLGNCERYDPWLQFIHGTRGHVYPYGDDWLVASCNSRLGVARQVAELPTAKVWREGEDGLDVLFKVGDMEAVASHLKLRIRPRLSEEQRRAKAERLRVSLQG